MWSECCKVCLSSVNVNAKKAKGMEISNSYNLSVQHVSFMLCIGNMLNRIVLFKLINFN